ncbi:MAG: hypothetical protein D6731_13400 [Planctomycetota bacterium]|nr:MAG: hypothetical protein D6731_13400 [Planctomycetota bacterium]
MTDFASRALAWARATASRTPCPCGHARGEPEPRPCGLQRIDLEAGEATEELELVFAVGCPSCRRVELFMPTDLDFEPAAED